ncbi:MAG: hypothetical protein NUV65_03360 [Candidatus Roizmanbacteria bacterium]|nr:hypothetical protein [Candidatus Roizmanbacteria bacterium]
MEHFLAEVPAWVGTINPPTGGGDYSTGLVPFINGGIRLVFVGLGLFALLEFVLAAYHMINSQGDSKNLEKARKMITNSAIGLIFLTMTFIFGAIIGTVFFGRWDFILDPAETINCTIVEKRARMLGCTDTDIKTGLKAIQDKTAGFTCSDVILKIKDCTDEDLKTKVPSCTMPALNSVTCP